MLSQLLKTVTIKQVREVLMPLPKFDFSDIEVGDYLSVLVDFAIVGGKAVLTGKVVEKDEQRELLTVDIGKRDVVVTMYEVIDIDPGKKVRKEVLKGVLLK